MKFHKITAVLATAMLGGGLVALSAAPASATEAPPAEACYTDETHSELTWEMQRSDWVAGVPEIPAVPASIEADWYTEGDDAAPTIDGESLVFTAPGSQAVGLRYATSFPVSELSGQSYTDVFHDRAVVDVDGTPFGTWRDDYLSLTFLSADTVWVAGANVEMTLADAIAAYPGTVTSFGYHMDSNAAAGTSYAVGGLVDPGTPAVPAVPDSYTAWYVVSSGQGVELPDGRADLEEFQTDGLYRYFVTGEVDVTEQVETECPATEEPAPSEEPTATEEPAATQAATPTGQLAETGFDAMWLPYAAAGLLVAGLAAVVIRRRLTKHDG